MMQSALKIQMEAEANLKVRTGQVRELQAELDECHVPFLALSSSDMRVSLLWSLVGWQW
jgi:protein tyrosine phosphatase (PTP) superfamily phosphohydrolase (DUF442 family)